LIPLYYEKSLLLLEKLRLRMNEDSFKRLYSKSSICFVRKRVWGFKEIFVGILHGLTKSLSVQVDSLLKSFGVSATLMSSKQAFSQARKKLKYEGFVELNKEFATNYYSDDEFILYHGYRLYGVDGSALKLPESQDIKDEFGCQTNCGLPMAWASILYDIENRVIVDSQLDKYASSERDQAKSHITKIAQIDNQRKIPTIILFDRGYPSVELMCLMISLGLDFVIRFEAENFVKATQEFAKSGALDAEVSIELSSLSSKTLYKVKAYVSILGQLNLRVIRLIREGEKDIFLITSLMQSSDSQGFSYKDFEEIYHKRWSVETQYDYLKNVMEIENFATKTALGIYQEFYATILCANIYQLLAQDAAQEIKEQNPPKKEIKTKLKTQNPNEKINFAVAAGLTKNELIDIIFSEKPIEAIYEQLIEKIKRNKIISKPDRSFKRKVKYKRKFNMNKRPVS
jgi:DNA-binding transcriptional ArsR family regulator